MKEIELKIILSDYNIDELLSKLVVEELNSFVRDEYFTSDNFNTLVNGHSIRIRHYNEQILFTYKGPIDRRNDNIISRSEYESMMDDELAIKAFLNALDFKVYAISEKYRTKLKSAIYGDLHIMIDRYPFIGSCLEVEGTETDINCFVNEMFPLGFKTDRRNNTMAFLDYCKEHNLYIENPELNFTFEYENRHKASTKD